MNCPASADEPAHHDTRRVPDRFLAVSRTSATSLLTDRYELTMLQAALRDGTACRRSVFEVFTRRLPSWRRYGVLAGTGRLLEELEAFRFGGEELDWLSDEHVVDDRTLDFLADYRFSGSVWGYAEGETYFPSSPVLTVEGTFAEAVLLETLALSVLNADSAVASAASRMTAAAAGRPCWDMGARRTHERAAPSAARAAAIAGFAGTSNLEAGRRWGLTTIGTSAHAFTLVHDSEAEAFTAQLESLGTGTTLLVDTYDVPTAVAEAVRLAGTGLGAVRLDSGDLATLAVEVRRQLDALGATRTAIVVTSDLDEYAIAALASAPVDSYGVGTRLVTGSGAPTSSMVYKLVAREGPDGTLEPVAKASSDKVGVGGRKTAWREHDAEGTATAEIVVTGDDDAVRGWRPRSASARGLVVPYVLDGEVQPGLTGPDAVVAAAERHARSVAALPRAAQRLSSGEPVIPTTLLSV